VQLVFLQLIFSLEQIALEHYALELIFSLERIALVQIFSLEQIFF
jgi:hypothetical protein